MNRLVIIGAGGHGKVIADIALKNGYKDICFVDDNAKGNCLGFPIVGTSEKLHELNDGKTDFVIAVGNNLIRKKIAERHNVNWVKLIHPSAQIGYGTEIEKGTVIMAGAIINADAKVGRHCIINSCAVIEHDNQLGDYVHVSPNAALGGTVHVGDLTHIGIGASVKNNVTIGKDTVIGAGAVVMKNISGEYTSVYPQSPRKNGQTPNGNQYTTICCVTERKVA